MINDVQHPTIGTLLSSDSPVVFKIPRYQREYTWTQKDWNNLFDDLQENDPGYFLGSTIVIDHGYKAEIGTTELELIDGQQRLTTLSILLAAIYSELNKYRDRADEDEEEVSTELVNLRNRLIMKKLKGATRVVPQAQGHNLKDFRSLLTEKVSSSLKESRAPYAGNRKIYRAFKYFESRLEGLVEFAPNPYEAIQDYLSKVCSSVIVQISVTTATEAYVLFESLNNRGVPLSAIDLIKNTLLASFTNASDEELDYYFERWQYMLKLLGEDYQNQERFLRQAYAAFRREVNKPFVTGNAQYPLGAVATRSNLLGIYESKIHRDPEATLDWLVENAQAYSMLIDPVQEGVSLELCESLQNLARIQGVPSYVLLLFLLRRQSDLTIEEQHIIKVNELLAKFFTRRNLTDTPPTRDLTRLFIAIVEAIEDTGSKGDQVFEMIKQRLLEVSASDAVFEEALSGPIYDTNPDVARFVLASLAAPSVTKEMAGLWDKTPSNVYVWTIEHIFPQGENIPDSWIQMMASGDKDLASKIQRECVHTLGNLTLTGYNSTLSNKSFEEKRDRRDQKGNYVGYRNGLNLNEELVEKNEWRKEDIESRTKTLVEQAKKLFAW